MPLTIEAVPSTIPRAVVFDFLRSLGLDVDRIPAHIPVEITHGALTCSVYAVDPADRSVIDAGTGEVLTHRIQIPLTD